MAGVAFSLVFLPIACLFSVVGILFSWRGKWFIRVLWALASVAFPVISLAALKLAAQYQLGQVTEFSVAVLVYVGSLLVWFLFVKCTPLKDGLHKSAVDEPMR